MLAVHKQALMVPWLIILFNNVYGASWAPHSVGDREMDRSQQSFQADRITRREFLYDVTDGWRGCHG